MNNALIDVAAEFLRQPWFMNPESDARLKSLQDKQDPRTTTLFQEYYY